MAEAPRFEDVPGVGVSFSRLTLLALFFVCLLFFIYLLLVKRSAAGGVQGSGMLSLLEEVERLQEADRILEHAHGEGEGMEPMPRIGERDLTE